MSNPCPFCKLPDGFHDDHAEARAHIPTHLKRPSNKALRRDSRKITLGRDDPDAEWAGMLWVPDR